MTPTSSPPASPAAINDTALKPTSSGVKKPAQKKKKKPNNDGIRHNQKAKIALRKMHAFCESASYF